MVFQSRGDILGWSRADDVPGVDFVDQTSFGHLLDASEHGPVWAKQPSVRKVVGFAARNAASVPLQLFERKSDTDRERVSNGALAALLREPSRAPGSTPYRFWEDLMIDRLIHDKSCAQIVLHDDGTYELIRIPASRVKFLGNGLSQIEGVRITSDSGRYIERPAEDFLIQVGYSPSGVNGLSSVRTLETLLEEYRESVAYRRSVWRNGARIPGVLTRDTPWSSDAARDRFVRGWQAFTRGGGREGGTPVLDDGMKYQEINAFRPKDTDDLEGRRLTDAEVASAYYIPPELVGAREGTASNIAAFRQMMYGPALGPYIIEWEQAVNKRLVPLFGDRADFYIEANVEAKLRGSFEEQISYLSTAVGRPFMTAAEARGRSNLPYIEGSDELVTPLNVLIGGQASPQDGITAGGGGGAKMPLLADDIARLVTAATALIRAGFAPEASLAAVGLDPIEHTGLLPVTVREDEPKSYEPVVQKFLDRQAQVVRSRKAAGLGGEWDAARWDSELTTDLVKAGMPYRTAIDIARSVNDGLELKHEKETAS